jgi:hypothetical protein
MSLSRKQFLKVTVALATAGLLPSCGDDDDGDSSSNGGAGTTSSSSASSSSTAGSGGDGAQGGGGASSGGRGGEAPGGHGVGGEGIGGAGGSQAMGDCQANGTAVAIVDNHGHEMIVSKEDVVAALEKVYDIQGASLHGHFVTLGAAELALLQQNQQVTVMSSTGGARAHMHAVHVTCI